MSNKELKSEQFQCTQLFGWEGESQKLIKEEDIITSVKFDPSGQFLAVGDAAGRVIMFASQQRGDPCSDYDHSFEFSSHERGFDQLKSVDIAERITHINWMQQQGKYHKIITSNSNTIKLWKIYEKNDYQLVRSAGKEMRMPKLKITPTTAINLKKTFPAKHQGPINSITLSSDQQYLLTSDSCSTFFWSLETAAEPYIVMQLLENSADRTEKKQQITCSELHPQNDSIFIFGTNKGQLSMQDLRVSVRNCHSLRFTHQQTIHNVFFSELAKKYTAATFCNGNRQIVTRDLISVKIWDVCNNREPIQTLPIDEHITGKLCDLFEIESPESNFSLSRSNKEIMTGNYSNSFHLIDLSTHENTQYQLDYSKKTHARKVGGGTKPHNAFNANNCILAHDFNPINNQIAVSSMSCFFIYSKQPPYLYA